MLNLLLFKLLEAGNRCVDIVAMLHVLYYSGPGTQPNTVVVSGNPVSTNINFGPSTDRATVTLSLTDDITGLETVEQFPLQVRPLDSRVSEGGPGLFAPTTIRITDDDSEQHILVLIISSKFSSCLVPS